MVRSWMPLVLLAALALAPSPALALDKDYIVKPKFDDKEDKVGEGWTLFAQAGSNVSLSTSTNVVGQQDGTSFTFGLSVAARLAFLRSGHEWRNILGLTELESSTAATGRLVKTTDSFKFDTLYLYHPKRIPWLGPFARLGFETSILPGYDTRTSDVVYRVKFLDGTTADSLPKAIFHLTDSFKPFSLKESLGAFAKALDRKDLTLEVHLGLGSRETFADGQLVTNDDKDTKNIIELDEIESYTQIGGELAILMNGTLLEDRLSYAISVESLLPFYSSGTNAGKNVLDLTSLEIGAKLSYKVTSWASLSYELKAVRLPKTLDAFQVQNLLLLAFSYSYTNKL
jgi:hypothetical protein